MAIELNNSGLINDANLTNYWRYEGNTTATKGAANGTITGTITNVDARFGKGYSHPGTVGNYIDYGAGTGVGTSGSLTFWINFTDFTTGASGNSVIPLTRRDTTGALNGTWQVALTNSLNVTPWQWQFAYVDSVGAKNKNSNGGTTLVTGTWYFVALVWDIVNAGNSAIYLNAQSLGIATDTTSATFVDAGTQTMRSGWSDNAASGCNCILDDVAIWSRRLTGAEVASLYSAGLLTLLGVG